MPSVMKLQYLIIVGSYMNTAEHNAVYGFHKFAMESIFDTLQWLDGINISKNSRYIF